ncbi:MAG: ABC transporter ATP-binding protein [Solirubrobacteraceae bacterium]|nr:ABC transporter ATP-binding protein [Solirubrobacteraceae bacterium]
MIACDQLVKRFPGRDALNGLSLHVPRGEIVALLGSNGAGKTTLLRILASRLVADAGTATIDGTDTAVGHRQLAGVVGAVLSSPSAWTLRLGALENLVVFGVAQGLTPKQASRAARQRLDEVRLSEHAGRPVGTYSQGMRARLAIARALLHDPPVLLLDEPTAGLDQQSATELVADLDRHRAERTVLISTHSLTEATALTDRAVLLAHGRVAIDVKTPTSEDELAGLLAGHGSGTP